MNGGVPRVRRGARARGGGGQERRVVIRRELLPPFDETRAVIGVWQRGGEQLA